MDQCPRGDESQESPSKVCQPRSTGWQGRGGRGGELQTPPVGSAPRLVLPAAPGGRCHSFRRRRERDAERGCRPVRGGRGMGEGPAAKSGGRGAGGAEWEGHSWGRVRSGEEHVALPSHWARSGTWHSTPKPSADARSLFPEGVGGCGGAVLMEQGEGFVLLRPELVSGAAEPLGPGGRRGSPGRPDLPVALGGTGRVVTCAPGTGASGCLGGSPWPRGSRQCDCVSGKGQEWTLPPQKQGAQRPGPRTAFEGPRFR